MKPLRPWVNSLKLNLLPRGLKAGWQFFYSYLLSLDWKTIFWCFCAATTFWIFNELNHTHSATVSYPLKFEFPKTDSAIINLLPDVNQVSVNVTAEGWRLLPLYLGISSDQITIKLDNLNQKKFITSNQILQYLSETYPDTKPNFVQGDTLRFNFEYLGSKTVKVQLPPSWIWLAPDAIMASHPILNPSQITVSGPLSSLALHPDTIETQIPINNISDDFEGIMPIKKLEIPHLTYSESNISVKFQVIKVKRLELVGHIRWLNYPKDTFVIADPDHAIVKMTFPADVFFKKDSLFDVVLDYRKVDRATQTVSPIVQIPKEAIQFKIIPNKFRVRSFKKR